MSSSDELVGVGDGICLLCMEPLGEEGVKCEHCPAEACCQQHLQVHRPDQYCFPFRIRQREGVG